MLQFKSRVGAFGIEKSANLRAFQLLVFIVATGQAEFCPVDRALKAVLAPDINPSLFEIDANRFLLRLRFLFPLFLLMVVVAGNAVVAVECADRDTDISAVSRP